MAVVFSRKAIFWGWFQAEIPQGNPSWIASLAKTRSFCDRLAWRNLAAKLAQVAGLRENLKMLWFRLKNLWISGTNVWKKVAGKYLKWIENEND
jgi:hypothetical protein